MRKSLWIMLAVMVVAVNAPNAHADSFTYAYSNSGDGISWTTEAIPAVTMPTTVLAADLTATSNTGFVAGCVTSSVTLDANGDGGTATFFSGCSTGAIELGDGFSIADYSTPGTYINSITSSTLVVTAAAVATPEPSSVALMLLGVGALLLLVMRRRIAQGLPMIS
jgi:hypothetical protein